MNVKLIRKIALCSQVFNIRYQPFFFITALAKNNIWIFGMKSKLGTFLFHLSNLQFGIQCTE